MQRNLSLLFLHYARLDRKRTSEGLDETDQATWLKLKRYLNQALAGARGSELDRRDSVRVPAELACTFGPIAAERAGVVANLSRSGFFVQSANPLSVGTRIWVQLRHPRSGELIEVVGVVATSFGPTTGSQDRKGMGIRFEAMAPAVRDALDELYRDAIVTRYSAVDAPGPVPTDLSEPA